MKIQTNILNNKMFSTKHKPYKYGFDISKPPDVPQHLPPGQKAQFLPSSDESLWLFSRSWELPPEHNHVAKPTLIICHGTVDHSGVYHDLAKALVKHGIAVFAQDMRGWGLVLARMEKWKVVMQSSANLILKHQNHITWLIWILMRK